MQYYLLRLQMNYHQYNGRYVKSNNYCKQLLAHIGKHEYLKKPSTIASIIANKGYNAVFRGKFPDAYKHITTAEQYFPVGSFNYTELQNIKFYAHYFSHAEEDAYALATYIQTAKYRKTAFQQAMWNYYLAVCYFNKGIYDKAQALLNQVQELKRDKAGWNLSIRILNICCSIELEKPLQADKLLDQLRFYYYKKQGLGARNNAIIKSILWLEDDYNYSKVYQKAQHEIDSLQSNKGWYKWDASRTPELFFFQRWFLAKMNKTEYKWEV